MQQRSTGELLRFGPPSEDFMCRAAEKTFTFNRKKFIRLPLQDMMETTYTEEIQKHIQVCVKWVSFLVFQLIYCPNPRLLWPTATIYL